MLLKLYTSDLSWFKRGDVPIPFKKLRNFCLSQLAYMQPYLSYIELEMLKKLGGGVGCHMPYLE